MKCPLDDSCDRTGCDALKLVEWQAKHTSNEHHVTRLANKVAKFKCKK